MIVTDIATPSSVAETGFETSGLTPEAQTNYSAAKAELARRVSIGLVPESVGSLSESDAVLDYLNRVAVVDPAFNALVDELLVGCAWKRPPKLVIPMPVVGTGDQEAATVAETIKRLSDDPRVKSGEVALLALVNRPEGAQPDDTAKTIQLAVDQLGVNAVVLETEVPFNLGSTDGPFAVEMATGSNQVPIALLRDMASVACMKLWVQNPTQTPPLMLQVDADFEGFAAGDFGSLINFFEGNSGVDFVQCTSDWKLPSPGEAGYSRALFVGAQLMRLLPQIVKSQLKNPLLPVQSRLQIIFGEAIQRGIQVPQAERMASVAKKGGYGLNRMAHDELDVNLRLTALRSPTSVVASGNELVLWWSARRAVKAWQEYSQPPISQWTGAEFLAIDAVRSASVARAAENGGDAKLLIAVNRTLERFPLPRRLEGAYNDARGAVLAVLGACGLNVSEVRIKRNGNKQCYLQVRM